MFCLGLMNFCRNYANVFRKCKTIWRLEDIANTFLIPGISETDKIENEIIHNFSIQSSFSIHSINQRARDLLPDRLRVLLAALYLEVDVHDDCQQHVEEDQED